MSRKDTSRLTEVTILLISSSKVGGLVVIPIPGIISSKFVNVFSLESYNVESSSSIIVFN
ncbi:Uncharacterised protein [Chlamydia trachomatis]|nr:Uncharacterised protein [Chlamydia trachomatis]